VLFDVSLTKTFRKCLYYTQLLDMSKMDGGSLGYQTICGVVKLRTRQVADWMIRHVIDSLTSHLLGENIERLSNPRFRKTFSRIHSSANRSVRQLSSFLLTSPRLD